MAILIFRVAFNVMLMALAGSLMAIYFHGLGDLIGRKTPIKGKWAMVASVTLTLVLIGALIWFIGTKIQAQVTDLSNTFPHTIDVTRAKLAKTPAGQFILKYSSDDHSKKLLDTATDFFHTSFGVAGDLYIILFLGIFFTASPGIYKDGFILMLPKEHKDLGRHVMDRISQSLRGWLKGMVFSIILITLMITAGLSIMGVPLSMVLGLITGLLEVVPNLGPLIAMIPGVLLAVTISTNTGIIVALLYIVSQTIVANIVTPIIQKRMISLPPVLTLLSQLIMGTLSGALGIILAVPLLAIVYILADELYVKKINE